MQLAAAPDDSLEIPQSFVFVSVRVNFSNGFSIDVGHEIIDIQDEKERAKALAFNPDDWDQFSYDQIGVWADTPEGGAIFEDNGAPTSFEAQVSDLPSAEHNVLLARLLDRGEQRLS